MKNKSKSSEIFKIPFLADGNTLEQDKKLEVVPEPIAVAKSTGNKSVDTTSSQDKSTHDKSAEDESTDDKKTNLESNEGRKIDDNSTAASNRLKGAKTDLKSPTKDDDFQKINIIEDTFMNKSTTLKPTVKETQHWSTSLVLRY